MSTRRTIRDTLGTMQRVTRKFGDFLLPRRDARSVARQEQRRRQEERWRREFWRDELWRFGNVGPYLKKRWRAAREVEAAAEATAHAEEMAALVAAAARRRAQAAHIADARRHAREEEEEDLEAWADEEEERERRLAEAFLGDEFLREHDGDEQPEGALGDLDAARGQRRRRGKTIKKSRTRKKRGRGKRKSLRRRRSKK